MRSVFLIGLLLGCGRDREGPRLEAPSASASGYCRSARDFTETPLPLSDVSGSAIRPTNTFSIVARDPATGDLGVAVQSHWFGVGAIVAWAEPGVGAVATQSFAEPAYGVKGLALMRSGVAPADAIAQLIAADPGAATRQLGFVDATGRAAAHTGARCMGIAHHHIGDGFTVQANIMANDRVVPAIVKAFETTRGDLAERMLAALDAGQAAGGDLRGCQSAAIRIVSGARETPAWVTKIDLRVEDHAAPLAELRRLVTLARAYDHMNQGDAAIGAGDIAGAVQHYRAAAALSPGNAEMTFWHAVALAGAGQVEQARPLFEQAYRDDPRWRELTRRLPAAGLLPAGVAGQVAQ